MRLNLKEIINSFLQKESMTTMGFMEKIIGFQLTLKLLGIKQITFVTHVEWNSSH